MEKVEETPQDMPEVIAVKTRPYELGLHATE
jgi:hypothetical protein